MTYKQTNLDFTRSSPRLNQVVSYESNDLVPTAPNNHGALVTGVVINNYLVKKAHLDAGSSIDVLCF